MNRVPLGVDRIQVTFDDEHLVANAGLLLVTTLAPRMGIEEVPTWPPADWEVLQGVHCRLLLDVGALDELAATVS